MTRKCPSQGRVRGKTWSGTAPSQSTSNKGAPMRIILSGRLQSNPGLEWLGCGGEGRAYLQGGKPLLELPTSSPQTFLLYPLTPRQDLTRFRGTNAFHSPRSKVSHPSGDISYRLTGGYGLVEQKTGPRVHLFPIKGQHVTSHTSSGVECMPALVSISTHISKAYLLGLAPEVGVCLFGDLF